MFRNPIDRRGVSQGDGCIFDTGAAQQESAARPAGYPIVELKNDNLIAARRQPDFRDPGLQILVDGRDEIGELHDA